MYLTQFVSRLNKVAILKELETLYPIWEKRYSEHLPSFPGRENRWLLRPVYWLGNWQFACLDYYHPPKGIENRCVQAEPYPLTIANLVTEIEDLVRTAIDPRDIPSDWHLNTCLINYYGQREGSSSREDAARVGEHKDFEPGPVASVSFGERALFQFIRSTHQRGRSEVIHQVWLEDCSLQVFAGKKWKKDLFHRVQRVEKNKVPLEFNPNTDDFTTRRINLTFRFVPKAHIRPLKSLPLSHFKAVTPYVDKLSQTSEYWKEQLAISRSFHFND